jgi:hypothetical protein
VLAAHNFELQGRFHNDATYLNSVQGGAQISLPVLSFLSLNTGGRVSITRKDLDALHYMTGLELRPLSLLRFGFRYSHSFYLPDTFTQSNLLLTTGLEVPVWEKLSFSVQGAWYKRYTSLKKISPIPVMFRYSYSEHDFGALIGFALGPFSGVSGKVTIATYDDILVYNLNHPFAELRLSSLLSPGGSTLSLLFRYQILLGFGRVDEWALGAALTFPLSINGT